MPNVRANHPATPAMRILFIHQNFPAQYKHLAQAFVAQPQHQVIALRGAQKTVQSWPAGLEVKTYTLTRNSTPAIHP